jgi:hypothetical protein
MVWFVWKSEGFAAHTGSRRLFQTHDVAAEGRNHTAHSRSDIILSHITINSGPETIILQLVLGIENINSSSSNLSANLNCRRASSIESSFTHNCNPIPRSDRIIRRRFTRAIELVWKWTKIQTTEHYSISEFIPTWNTSSTNQRPPRRGK